MPAKFAEGDAARALRGSRLGERDPRVQLGGMSGKARLARARAQEGRGAAAHHLRGAAAGMSAAFHAPLTGVLFALEEIHKEFTAPLIISVMCSAVVSDFLVSQVLGVSPVVSLSCRGQPSPHVDYLFVIAPRPALRVCSAPCTTGGMFAAQGPPCAHPRAPGASCAWESPSRSRARRPSRGPSSCAAAMRSSSCCAAPAFPSLAALVTLLVGKYVFTAVCFGSGRAGWDALPLGGPWRARGSGDGRRGARPGACPPRSAPTSSRSAWRGLFSGVVRGAGDRRRPGL